MVYSSHPNIYYHFNHHRCVLLLLQISGIEPNPGPVHGQLEFKYGSIRDIKPTNSQAKHPNGALYTGPSYEPNHSINNNSVIQITEARFANCYDLGQRDRTYPLKGSFLYPIKLGLREEVLDDVRRKRIIPPPPSQRSLCGSTAHGESDDDFRRPLSVGPPSYKPPTTECTDSQGVSDASTTLLSKSKKRRIRKRKTRGQLEDNRSNKRIGAPCSYTLPSTSNQDDSSWSDISDTSTDSVRSNEQVYADVTNDYSRRVRAKKDNDSDYNSDYSIYEDRGGFVHTYKPEPVGGTNPKFSCYVKLDLDSFSKFIYDILADCIPTVPPPADKCWVTVQVSYIDSSVGIDSVKILSWSPSSSDRNNSKGRIEFPKCKCIDIAISRSLIRRDDHVQECIVDATLIASKLHFFCEASSGLCWTIDPSKLVTGVQGMQDGKIDKDHDAWVIRQGDPGYRCLSLVPTTCSNKASSYTCNRAKIVGLLRSMGDECMAASHGQSSIHLTEDTSLPDQPTLVSLEVDPNPLDSWGYYQVKSDFSAAAAQIGCKSNVNLKVSDKMNYMHLIGYDDQGIVFDLISPVDFSYRASYFKKQNTDFTKTDFEPSSLNFSPTFTLMDLVLDKIPSHGFNLFWVGFWSKASNLGIYGSRANSATKKPFSLKDCWKRTLPVNPIKWNGVVARLPSYAKINYLNQTRDVIFDMRMVQRSPFYLLPLVVPTVKHDQFDVSKSGDDFTNSRGFKLFNNTVNPPTSCYRGVLLGIRYELMNSSGRTSFPTRTINQYCQKYNSLGTLGRDLLEAAAVIEDSEINFHDFDAITGLILCPTICGSQCTVDPAWQNYASFSQLRNAGFGGSYFISGSSQDCTYTLLAAPSNKELFIFKFFRYIFQMATEENRQWVVTLAKNIVDVLPLDKSTKEKINDAIGWADAIIGILITVASFFTSFLNTGDYDNSRRLQASQHFSDFSELFQGPRKKNYFFTSVHNDFIVHLVQSGSDRLQSNTACSIDNLLRRGDNDVYYGAVPRHAVKQLLNPTTTCEVTAAISSIYNTFRQSYHELRNQGSMMNGVLTYDVLKLLFSSGSNDNTLPSFLIGSDKLILTYHLWVHTLLAGQMFVKDQVGLKLPSLSSFNAFALADVQAVTDAGLPVTGKNLEPNDVSYVTWLETNAIQCWDICGNNNNIIPRWGTDGELEFSYADMFDPQAKNVLFVPSDWAITGNESRDLAILIILTTGWGRLYPVITHSFTGENNTPLEAIYAINAGWTHVDGPVDLKVVLPVSFPLTGAKFGNLEAAQSALRIKPTYGNCYGYGGALCNITWLNVAGQSQRNVISLHNYIMSWMGQIGLNDIMTFATQCFPWFNLNDHFTDYFTLAQSLSIFHGPAEEVTKGDATTDYSTIDFMGTTTVPKSLFSYTVDRTYPHVTPEGRYEDWWLPLNDGNRNVPHIYHTRKEIDTDPPCFSLTYTHQMEVFNITRLSLLMLGLFSYPKTASDGAYDSSSDLPYQVFPYATIRSIVSSSVYALQGLPPSFIIRQGADERTTNSYDIYYRARESPAYRTAVLHLSGFFGRSVLNCKHSLPLWIHTQNSYDTNILMGTVPSIPHVAAYRQMFGDVITVKLRSIEQQEDYYTLRSASRYNYSKLAANICCFDTPDFMRLLARISEYQSEQPILTGLQPYIDTVDTAGGVYQTEGYPLVPTPGITQNSWKIKGELFPPDPYLLTLTNIIACASSSSLDADTFSIKQIDMRDVQAADTFQRTPPTCIVVENIRTNSQSWFYAGEQLITQQYGLIVPWNFQLKRPSLSNLSPLVITTDDRRRSIRLLQGVTRLALNQVIINRLGASLVFPVQGMDASGADQGFSFLFGPGSSKNSSKGPTGAGSGSAPNNGGLTQTAGSLSAEPAEGGLSASQDAGTILPEVL